MVYLPAPSRFIPPSRNAAMTNQKIRVLVIDDDNDCARIIRMYLDESDSMGMAFEVERADRLAAGLRALEAAPFAALLLDLMLPDSQGLDTMMQVLSRGRDIPILVTTNLDDESAAVDALRLGAEDYLIKSAFDSRLLKSAIRQAIERHRRLETFLP